MDFVSKLKDTLVPDNDHQQTATPPATDVPGGFPDMDDEQLGKEIENSHNDNNNNNNKPTQNHHHKDSGIEVGGDSNPLKSAPTRTATGAAGDNVQQALPERQKETPASETTKTPKLETVGSRDFASTPDVGTGHSGDAMSSTQEVRPMHLGNEGTTPRTGSTPDVGTGHSGDAMTSVEEVRPQHLGNEGTTPRTGTTPDVGTGHSGDAMGSVEEVAPKHLGNEGVTPRPEGARSREAMPDDRPLAGASDISGRGSAEEASGGIHNGVLGAGSSDPKGERSGSPHERTSQYRKGDVHTVISGVSESGLGQGGIHNGVVGHGSKDDETARRSSSTLGQEADSTA